MSTDAHRPILKKVLSSRRQHESTLYDDSLEEAMLDIGSPREQHSPEKITATTTETHSLNHSPSLAYGHQSSRVKKPPHVHASMPVGNKD